MNNTKEKAIELVKKFSPLVTTWDCYFDIRRNEEDIITDAKKCALVTVDEILESHLMSVNCEEIVIDFWNKVKTEIRKL